MRMTAAVAAILLLCLSLLPIGGCVEQTLSIDSNPPGALVYLNDQEVGRTPLTRDFKWYGDYDIQVRQEGYQTLSTHQMLAAPAWNWVPLDLFAYILPLKFKDHKSLSYSLKPMDPSKNEPTELVQRAESMRGQLESSVFTRVPTPRAATRTTGGAATTQPATQPTTNR